MIDRRQTSAPGSVMRTLGLWVLLAGVLVMHIVALMPGRMMHAGHVAGQSITASAVTHPAAAGDAAMPMTIHPDSPRASAGAVHVMSAIPDSPATTPSTSWALPMRATAGMDAMHPCDCGDCAMPGMMHACVFILTALTLLLGLALLGRISGRTADSARPAPRWLSRRARPPPWTMPSLAELSILRI